MHTPLCRHAVGEPDEYAAAALAAGLTEIGFSDHSPMPNDDFDVWRMYLRNLDVYVANVRATQKKYPQLTIKLAMEVDYIPGYEDWTKELAGRYPWDYFIGSVHYVADDWAIDDPAHLSKWKGRDRYEVWSVYFDLLTRAATSGMFEIIGHADLPKKFNIRPDEDCRPLYAKFLDAAKGANVAYELNTAGLRKDCKEIYPTRALVEMGAERGVPITFGSDAHAPGEVAYAFKDAMELARSVGYTESCRFTQRKRTMEKF
jgi:histidinol-phosphatase (PHP family)